MLILGTIVLIFYHCVTIAANTVVSVIPWLRESEVG